MSWLKKSILLLRQRALGRCLRQDFVKSSVAADVQETKPFEDIPGPSGIYNIPLIGAMFHLKPFTNYSLENLHLLYNSLLNKYGRLVKVKLGQWMVLVEDGEDMEKIMRSEGRHPNRPLPLIHVWYCEKHGAKKGIGILTGEEWYRLRRPVNAKLLKPDSAHQYLPIQNEVGDELVECLKENRSAEEIQDLFFRYACESISSVVFNERLGYLKEDAKTDMEKQRVLNDLKRIFEIFNNTLTIPPCVLMNVPLKVKDDYKASADNIIRYVEKHYNSILRDIKERGDAAIPEVKSDFARSLLLMDNLSVEEMGTVALDLFAAGTDSTARNIQIFLLNMARHSNKQQKLFEEISQVVGDGPVTKEKLAKMKYLVACVRESMRLYYPTITGVQRILPTDITLQGYRIPAGTILSLMNQKTVKNEKYFPSPERFEPERWLRDSEGKRTCPIPTQALLPFGFGPRQCIGKRFAEQEIYLAIIKIIQNFEVSMETEENVEVIYRIFVGPRNPIRFIFKRRH